MTQVDRLVEARSQDITAEQAGNAQKWESTPDDLAVDPFAPIGAETSAPATPVHVENIDSKLASLRSLNGSTEVPDAEPQFASPHDPTQSLTTEELQREMGTPADQRDALYAKTLSVDTVSSADARKNWNDMMTAERAKATQERENKTVQEAAIAAAYAPKTSDLLNDSELVQSQRARHQRLTPLTKLKHARDVRKMDKDFQKLQKQQVKETKAFDKAAVKERAFQDVEDTAVLRAVGRQEQLEDKLFEKRLAAEAKLKAKQDKKLEYARGKEVAKVKRDKLFGGIAARASLRFGRR